MLRTTKNLPAVAGPPNAVCDEDCRHRADLYRMKTGRAVYGSAADLSQLCRSRFRFLRYPGSA